MRLITKYILIFNFLLCTLLSQAKDYSLTATNSDPASLDKMYLIQVSGLAQKKIDSAQAKQGVYKFSIPEKLAKKRMYKLQLGQVNPMAADPNKFLEVIANEEDITLRFEKGNLSTAVFESSKENQNYAAFKADFIPTEQLLASLLQATALYPKDQAFYPTLRSEYQRIDSLRSALIAKHTAPEFGFSSELIQSELNMQLSPDVPVQLHAKFLEVNHFSNIDWHNPALVNTEIIPRKLFQYFNLIQARQMQPQQLEKKVQDLVKQITTLAQDNFEMLNFISQLFQNMFQYSLPNVYYYTKAQFDFSEVQVIATERGKKVSLREFSTSKALYRIAYLFSSVTPNYPEAIAYLQQLQAKNKEVHSFYFSFDTQSSTYIDLKTNKQIPAETIEVHDSYNAELARQLGAYNLPLFVVLNSQNEISYFTDNLDALKEFTVGVNLRVHP